MIDTRPIKHGKIMKESPSKVHFWWPLNQFVIDHTDRRGNKTQKIIPNEHVAEWVAREPLVPEMFKPGAKSAPSAKAPAKTKAKK